MSKSLKINYFPRFEFIIFTLSVLGLFLAYLFSGLNIWLAIFLIVFSYLKIMSSASIINLDDKTLKITSFNPLLASHTINTKSITKINSIQTMEHKTEVQYGGSFFLFSRRYELEYFDFNGKKRIAYFSIHNKNKEETIIKVLSSLIYNR